MPEGAPDLTRMLVPTLLIGLGLYAYTAYCLMTIARKSSTPSAWLAWVPVANLYLMCLIGRKSPVWLLLLLIPFVNIIFFIALWAAIANVRGKPGWTALLFLVPLVNLALPAYYASGTARTAATAAAGPEPAGAGTGEGAAATDVCAACGEPMEPQDVFCGECGGARAVTAPAAAPPPAQRTNPLLLGCVLTAGSLVLIAAASVGWFFFGPGARYTPPERVDPAVPARLAGTLTEFPVDTDPDDPAAPTTIVSQEFRDGRGDAKVPEAWLPPGLDSRELSRRATAVTSAAYRTKDPAVQVNVHVITIPTNRAAAEEVAVEVARQSGGERSRVTLESPGGEVYTGYSVKGRKLVYVLLNQLANILIVIYAPEPVAFPTAQRLAAGVGNGRGLYDYPQVSRTFGSLPARLPAGLVLNEVNTYTPSDFEVDLAELERELGPDVDPEVRQMISQVRAFLPESLTVATYRDREDREWGIALGNFGTKRASRLWWFLRWTAGLAMETVRVAGENGLYADIDDGHLIIFRRGPYVTALVAPPGAAPPALVALGDSMQM